jgi:hypothetical protein
LAGNGFFLEFTSIGNFLVKKSEKNAFRRVPILACFLVNNLGGKKMAIKRQISFPQFLSLGVPFLHEVPQCKQFFFHQFDRQMLRKNIFMRRTVFFVSEIRRKKSIFLSICGCGQIGGHFFEYIVVKLQSQRIKIVEIRAKSV